MSEVQVLHLLNSLILFTRTDRTRAPACQQGHVDVFYGVPCCCVLPAVALAALVAAAMLGWSTEQRGMKVVEVPDEA